MARGNSYVFLPQAIHVWGGIDNYLSGTRTDGMVGRQKYAGPPRGKEVMGWIARRLARSGKFPVSRANAILWLAACRYSGTPERTFNAYMIFGAGTVVTNEWGHEDASMPMHAMARLHEEAVKEAKDDMRRFSLSTSAHAPQSFAHEVWPDKRWREQSAQMRAVFDHYCDDRRPRWRKPAHLPDGPFCILGNHKACSVCGAICSYEQVSHAEDGFAIEEVALDARVKGSAIHRLCKSRKCRAVAAYFPKVPGKYIDAGLPLIHVLLEVTKHAGNNAHKRGLEKHFVRHAGQVHQRRDRLAISQGGGEAGRQPAEVGRH